VLSKEDESGAPFRGAEVVLRKGYKGRQDKHRTQ
jgi:hypothetical protein